VDVDARHAAADEEHEEGSDRDREKEIPPAHPFCLTETIVVVWLPDPTENPIQMPTRVPELTPPSAPLLSWESV
jgi:hypothetical protein